MQVDEFDYQLPEELIAQKPVDKRDESRLMLLNHRTGSLKHEYFKNILDYLNPGDLIVRNNSKVIPARLYGKKVPTGTEIEVLLLNEIKKDIWQVLVKPGRRVKKDTVISFAEGLLKAKSVDYTDFGGRIMEFNYQGEFASILDQIGQMPLPPYITRELKEPDRYQTVYAQKKGSAAAPTAGLHFTPELLKSLKEKGIQIADITLHVGLGTFRPVKVNNVEEHDMHAEYYEISSETVSRIKKTKKAGKRIIAIGTTVTRTLEGVVTEKGQLEESKGWTDIFIYPGYEFKVIDGIITNFHLPKSTLIMLVSAFAGKKKVMKAYKTAVEKKYRFYSFGDAMFIY